MLEKRFHGLHTFIETWKDTPEGVIYYLVSQYYLLKKVLVQKNAAIEVRKSTIKTIKEKAEAEPQPSLFRLGKT